MAPPEIRLWLAVVAQTVADAGNRGDAPADRRRREQARAWLTEPDRGLHQVLALVGVEPDWWRRRAVPGLLEAWAAGRAYARRRRPRERTPARHVWGPPRAAAVLGHHRRPGGRPFARTRSRRCCTRWPASTRARATSAPAHIHFFVSAPGYRQLTTQINIDGDEYLHDDFALATRDGLIPQIRRVDEPAALREHGLDAPFARITFESRDLRQIKPKFYVYERKINTYVRIIRFEGAISSMFSPACNTNSKFNSIDFCVENLSPRRRYDTAATPDSTPETQAGSEFRHHRHLFSHIFSP